MMTEIFTLLMLLVDILIYIALLDIKVLLTPVEEEQEAESEE